MNFDFEISRVDCILVIVHGKGSELTITTRYRQTVERERERERESISKLTVLLKR